MLSIRKNILFLISLIFFIKVTYITTFSYQDDFYVVPIGIPVAMQVKTDTSLIEGMGTITYYNPKTEKFGALGHAITEGENVAMINEGHIFKPSKINITKGETGFPGEISADIDYKNKLGTITSNSLTGIYGDFLQIEVLDSVLAAKRADIKLGEASLLSNIDGSFKEYKINIENINPHKTDKTKSFVISIEDETLLNLTGGIIQGMSGSPILQNNKIVGAVTHVFVSNPTKGYGIFIETMLAHES